MLERSIQELLTSAPQVTEDARLHRNVKVLLVASKGEAVPSPHEYVCQMRTGKATGPLLASQFFNREEFAALRLSQYCDVLIPLLASQPSSWRNRRERMDSQKGFLVYVCALTEILADAKLSLAFNRAFGKNNQGPCMMLCDRPQIERHAPTIVL